MPGLLHSLLFIIMISSGVSYKSVSPDNKTEDCITCHSDLMKNKYIHPELATMCDVCHSPTGEVHPKQSVKGFILSEKLPVLCYNCHSEFQEKADKYPIVHNPIKDQVSCLNCHNPHSSPEIKLINNGINDLCLKCHNQTIKNDSIKIRNVGQILSRAKSIHPPIEQGGCVNCHNPHFSEKRALLIGNFPSGQYVKATDDAFELCFMCHDSDLLNAKNTEFGTSFRNGTANLHFIHVKSDKGRNCTMCHNVHGAGNARLINDKLQFGRWEMKINFSVSDNGGSCLTACHSEKKYDRTILKETTTVKK